MVVAALALQAAFLLLAFGLRTALHARQTGSSGFRALSRNASVRERAAVAILTAGGAMSLAGTALGDVAPVFSVLDHAGVRWSGAAVAVLATALVLVAQSTMGRSWRIGVDPAERTDLVMHGLFALVRNPIFSAMLAFWAGIALLIPNAVTLLAVAVAWVGVEVQVRAVEEPYLLRTHGDAYRRYASRTGRLLPGIGKMRA